MELNESSLIRDFPAAAEYLSNIYLIQRDYGVVTNSHLAQWLGVSMPAVTQALGRLKKLGLVQQERYEPMTLTADGRQLATTVLKRHYLLEHLLVRVLDYPWDKADEEAKVLQNQISDDLAAHLDARLGHPQTCPHGNPLPGTAVERKLLDAPILVDAPLGQEVLILRITEEGEAMPEMLPTCQALGIRPGVRLTVLGLEDDKLSLKPAAAPEGTELRLPVRLAKHIRFEGKQAG